MITGLLDGLTLEEAVTQGRLFFQDYHSVLADDIAPQVLSAAPCLSSVIWLLCCYSVLYSILHFMLNSTRKQGVCSHHCLNLGTIISTVT